VTTVAGVETHVVRVPLRRPFVTAVRAADALDVLLVAVTDSDGRTGWGEVALSWRVTGESVVGARAVVHGPLADAITGLPVDDARGPLAGAVAHNAAARAAVDTALWDVAAQVRGVPLHRLLDPASPAETRTDMTLSAGEPDAVLGAAAEHVTEGFGTLKVKLGVDPARDDRVLRALRAGPAAGVRLRVDANQGWTAAEAIRLVRGWEDDGLGVELVEQPTPAHDVEALAAVTAAVDTPVLADESVWDVRDLREVLRTRAADLVNVKLAKCGGITAARTLVNTAAEAGVGVLVGSMLESVVGVTAAAHLAATLPGHVHDLDAGRWLRDPPVTGGAHYAPGGRIVLPPHPGLGIEGPTT
jgi:L-Ala-D/L-Glu epimerase